jgi:hypothetical protein
LGARTPKVMSDSNAVVSQRFEALTVRVHGIIDSIIAKYHASDPGLRLELMTAPAGTDNSGLVSLHEFVCVFGFSVAILSLF